MLLLHEAKPLVLMDLRTFYHCSRAAASKLCGKGFTFQVSYYFNGLTEAQYTSSSTETKEKRVEKSGNNIILFFFFLLVDQIVRKMRSCHSIRKLFWPLFRAALPPDFLSILSLFCSLTSHTSSFGSLYITPNPTLLI